MNELMKIISGISSPVTGIIIITTAFIYYLLKAKTDDTKFKKVSLITGIGLLLLFVIQGIAEFRNNDEFKEVKHQVAKIKNEKDTLSVINQVSAKRLNDCESKTKELEEKLEQTIQNNNELSEQKSSLELDNKTLQKDIKKAEKNEKDNVFKYVGEFYEGYAVVKSYNDKYGFINKNHNLIVPCMYKSAAHFSNGLAGILNEKSKWGFINKMGDIAIPCKYDKAKMFEKNRAIVKIGTTSWFEIDKEGEWKRSVPTPKDEK